MATPFLGFENDVENTLQPGVAFNQLAGDVDTALAGNVVVDFTADEALTLTRDQWMTSVLVLTDTGPVLTGGVDVIFPDAFPGALVVNDTAQTLTLTNGLTDEVTLDAGEAVRIAAGPDGVLASSAGGGGGSGIVESIVAGTNVTVDSTDPANPIVSATGGGGGSGDVVGPASATDGVMALFDGTTGKLLKAGGAPLTNPMTTAGDIIYGGTSGVATRLPKGTDGQVLTLASGIPSWATGGGGSLTNWTEAANSSAPNATAPVVSFTANNAAANVDVALVAKGTGAILAQVPTGTTVGGNKRGQYAVDFQSNRSGASNVASGDTSFLGNGNGNTASGQYSFVGCGLTCSASNTGSAVVGGTSNTANADYSWIPGGRNAQTRAIIGAGARACGQFSSQGDAQSMCLVLRRATTNATPAVLTSDAAAGGILNQMALPNNSAYLVKGSVVARESATGDSKTWDFTCHIARGANAAATTLIAGGTPTSIGASAGAAAWTVDVSADTSNGCVKVQVTGEASKSIKWVCDIYSAVQVVG